MGMEMVQEVQRIVRARYPSGGDNRKRNTTRLENSFTFKVERGSGPHGFPFSVSLTTKPGVAAGKVAALNYGVTPRPTDYTILPRNVPRALKFQGADPNRARRSGKTGRFIKQSPKGGAYAGQTLRPSAHRTMTSGPKKGGLFMEEAREIVMRRHGYL